MSRWEDSTPLKGFIVRFDGEKNAASPCLWGDGAAAAQWAAKMVEPGKTATVIEIREVSHVVVGQAKKSSMPAPPKGFPLPPGAFTV